MRLQSFYEFLFVGTDEGNFVENYAYDLGEGGESSGKIFITLDIQGNPAEAESIGETMFDTMRRVFFAEVDKDPYARFESAIKSVNQELHSIKEQKSSRFIGHLNVLIVAIVGNDLFLTQCGESEAYLIRKRLCSSISEGLQDEESPDVFSNIASGTLEPGDFVLLGSTRLLRYISKTDLGKICSSRNLVSCLAELKEFLAAEALTRVGAIGIQMVEMPSHSSQSHDPTITSHMEKEEVYSAQDSRRKVSEEGAYKKATTALLDALEKVKSLTSDLKDRVTTSSGRSNYRSPNREVKSVGMPWSKDKIIIAFGLCLFLLVIGLWWLKAKGDEQQTIEKYTKELTDAQSQVSTAETTKNYSKEEALKLLVSAQTKAVEVLNSGYLRAKSNELLKQIEVARDGIDGVSHPKAKVLVDLSLKRPNVSALGILSVNKQLFAYEYNALYPILADKVQDPLTLTDGTDKVVAAAAYDDLNSLLFLTQSGKLLEYLDSRVSFVDSSDGSFKKGTALSAYSNKLFVLDPAGNQIWRYTRRRDKFDPAEPYNVNGDVKKGTSIAIDGNIYVLNSDGTITRFYLGNTESFPMKKLPSTPASHPVKIYTEADLTQIFVLDPENKRVLVYYKDERNGLSAVYNNQYVFDDIPNLKDMYFDKDTNKLYLVDETKVYEVGL